MDFVEQVKSSVDIVQVIGEYVRLRKATSSRFTGLCPFHTEKTPSFSVNAAHQFYYCFGCHEKGDVFNFLMQIEGLTFFEALKSVAERYGIPMPARREYSDPDTKLRDALYRMQDIAAAQFQNALAGAAGAEARAYLAKRGLTPETVAEFGLGYAERGGHSLLRALEREEFSSSVLEASGLVLKRDSGGFFDRFRNRLMFPIQNESGKVIAFGGRALAAGDEPKYLNSPETAIYKKSSVLYNLHRAKAAIRKQERAILVEGYMDVIGVYSAGIPEVVASCGTALTNLQVRAIKRHSEKIVVNFDPDTAGATASERSIQLLLDEGMRVRILQLEGDLDPDEYIRFNGADTYRDRLASANSYYLWLADRARTRFDTRSAEGRIDGFKWLLPAIRRISDKIERAAVADEIAAYLGVDRALVLDEFRKSGPAKQLARKQAAGSATPRVERVLLRSIVGQQEVRDVLIPKLRGFSVLSRFHSARIIEAACRLYESHPSFSLQDIEGRLEERERALLVEAVFADSTGEEVFTPEQALSYLNVLEREEQGARLKELRNRAKEAAAKGNLELATQLAREMDELNRTLRAGGPQ